MFFLDGRYINFQLKFKLAVSRGLYFQIDGRIYTECIAFSSIQVEILSFR